MTYHDNFYDLYFYICNMSYMYKYIKIHKTYGTHIYLICILCTHIILCHSFLYHILVHIQVGNIATDKEKRLIKCVENVINEKDKAEQECDLMKCKVNDLKQLLVPGVEMSDQELEHLVNEIQDYQKKMEQARKTNEVKFISIYDCTFSHNGSTWCSRENAVS